MEHFTALLAGMQQGDSAATSKLAPLVYGELRRLAKSYMRTERANHTLQPTALVNEAFLRLVEDRSISWECRAHFFGVAARVMRQILVDYAREHNALKRGSGQSNLVLDEALAPGHEKSEEVMILDDALRRLEQIDPRQSRIIELRFFGGLSVEETAEVMNLSTRTVKREWSVARLWLHREIRGGE